MELIYGFKYGNKYRDFFFFFLDTFVEGKVSRYIMRHLGLSHLKLKGLFIVLDEKVLLEKFFADYLDIGCNVVDKNGIKELKKNLGRKVESLKNKDQKKEYSNKTFIFGILWPRIYTVLKYFIVLLKYF